ncbi:MAG: 4-(cytidine 5'-diphospho)-2-C-methyl-D-erythritol kinase [Candidatus Omnitrophica bacterium]|nr:4-(cytidine 5'-diphospho)-2-C-methyl-D-erythritol kinase [Candidatus Omnitrophota bacterium]MDD5662212.1 4-(cytidine 5'-diphospho)-2-C-methyl-D-erythritol kinase [Candidatus Omnitrophota bacterium]
MVIYSFAKVNLALEIISKRPDNYHKLSTLFERISLRDKIILKNRRDNLIKVYCSDPSIPRGKSNLCWQAAKLLQDEFKVKKGLDIKITKHIPAGAGLGGGSSNAAGILLALNKLWGLQLDKPRLAALGAQLGSDVPFFIYDTPFAQGEGRGEEVHVLKELNRVKLWHILVVPEIHVSTPRIYERWDTCLPAGRAFSGLTKPASNVKIIISKLTKKNPLFEPGLLSNSLEPVTLKLYPEVRRIKEKLKRLRLKNILMSGSGGAVFAIVSSESKAVTLARRLKKEGGPWRVFAVSTV